MTKTKEILTAGGWAYDKCAWDRWCSLTTQEAREMPLDELGELAASGPPLLPREMKNAVEEPGRG